jgi:hypothetical protein
MNSSEWGIGRGGTSLADFPDRRGFEDRGEGMCRVMDGEQSSWADPIERFERMRRRGELRSDSEARRYDERVTRWMVACGLLSMHELTSRRRASAFGGER